MMKNNLKLYLDDMRTPTDPEWIVVRNYDQFVKMVMEHGIEAFHTISLDHDLGDTAMAEYWNNVQPNYKLDYTNITEKTGLDCIKWLVEHFLNKPIVENTETTFMFPQIYSHSANPIGAYNIIGYANNFLKNMKQPQTCVRVRIDHTVKES
jgi:hypothetical protein